MKPIGESVLSHWNSYQPPEDGLPPEQVCVIELRTEPWPDQTRRVRVVLEITPFLERPSLQVVITRPDGAEVSGIHIIETIEARMTFTMHIRDDQGQGPYQLKAIVLYPETGTVDEKSIAFDLPETTQPPA